MELCIHKHLFSAYCGLIYSGYNRMDLNDPIVRDVCRGLNSIPFPTALRKYFAFTKVGKVDVNPWYPTGSDMAAFCFFPEEQQEEYFTFLQEQNSPNFSDPVFHNWISSLPEVLASIEVLEGFDLLFESYRSAVSARFAHLLTVPAVSDVPFPIPEIIFAPNLLQAPFLADFARVDGRLFCIAGWYSQTLGLHESLHMALRPCHPILEQALCRRGLDAYVDVKKVQNFGYLICGEAHALEECAVRALSCAFGDEKDKPAYAQRMAVDGFTAVPGMLQKLQKTDLTELKPLLELILS